MPVQHSPRDISFPPCDSIGAGRGVETVWLMLGLGSL